MTKTVSASVLAVLAWGCNDAKSDVALTVAAVRSQKCLPNPDFVCSDDAVWSERESQLFGHAGHPVGEDGCMKVSCNTQDDCPAGWACYRPECYPLNVSCQDVIIEGEKSCECSADPACGGAFCRPE
jgi:hypothetical protein